MGKDNAYFHTVYFPGMLLADGRNWTTLHHLSVTGQLQRLSDVDFVYHTACRASQLRVRKILQISQCWGLWPLRQRYWRACICVAVLFIVESTGDWGLCVLLGGSGQSPSCVLRPMFSYPPRSQAIILYYSTSA
jgi:hypothetical protein